MAWTNIEYAPGWGPLASPADVLKARVEGDWVVVPPALIATTTVDPGLTKKMLTAYQYYRVSGPLPVEFMPPVDGSGKALARAPYLLTHTRGTAFIPTFIYLNASDRCLYVQPLSTVSLVLGSQHYIPVPDMRWLRAV